MARANEPYIDNKPGEREQEVMNRYGEPIALIEDDGPETVVRYGPEFSKSVAFRSADVDGDGDDPAWDWIVYHEETLTAAVDDPGITLE